MHQDNPQSEKIVLPTARIGTILSGDAYLRIPHLGRLVRVIDPAAVRPRPRSTRFEHEGDPTPSRRRSGRRRHSVTAVPGAWTRRQESSGNVCLGASEWPRGTCWPIVERAAAPVGGVPVRHRSSLADGPDGGQAVALGRALFADRRWQHSEPARQQRNRLAPARGLRPRPGRVLPSGSHRPDGRGIAAASRAGDGRGFDGRPWLRESQRVAGLSYSIRARHARLHRPGWLESRGAARSGGRSIQFDHATERAVRRRCSAGMGGAGRGRLRPATHFAASPVDRDAAARRQSRSQTREAETQCQQAREILDPRSLIAAGFMVLVTSLPAEISADQICAAYRMRWQIELAFKRLKSLIHLDRLPTRTTAGSLSWLYAHIILALLTEDICQDFLESSP